MATSGFVYTHDWNQRSSLEMNWLGSVVKTTSLIEFSCFSPNQLIIIEHYVLITLRKKSLKLVVS